MSLRKVTSNCLTSSWKTLLYKKHTKIHDLSEHKTPAACVCQGQITKYQLLVSAKGRSDKRTRSFFEIQRTVNVETRPSIMFSGFGHLNYKCVLASGISHLSSTEINPVAERECWTPGLRPNIPVLLLLLLFFIFLHIE